MSMFEVGKTYRITTGDGDERRYSIYTVLEADGPLLKVQTGGVDKVINTSSSTFIEAELFEGDSKSGSKFASLVGQMHGNEDEDDQRDREQAERDESASRNPITGY